MQLWLEADAGSSFSAAADRVWAGSAADVAVVELDDVHGQSEALSLVGTGARGVRPTCGWRVLGGRGRPRRRHSRTFLWQCLALAQAVRGEVATPRGERALPAGFEELSEDMGALGAACAQHGLGGEFRQYVLRQQSAK